MMLIDHYIDSSSQFPFYKDIDCFLVRKPTSIIKTVIVHENPEIYLSYLRDILRSSDPAFVPLISVSHHQQHDHLYSYSYEMAILSPLTEDESKFLTSVAPCYPGPWDQSSRVSFEASLKDQSNFLDLPINALLAFYDAVAASPYLHPDFAAHNVMKTKFGQFHLIDFENLRKRIR